MTENIEEVPIARYPDPESGTEIRVWPLKDGRFSVTVYDVDAQETCPHFRIFDTLPAAISYIED